MGIFNACATDNAFKSISPVKVCKQYVHTGAAGDWDYPGTWTCAQYAEEMTTMPRAGVRHECVKQDTSEAGYPNCLEYADVAYTLGTTVSVEVMHTGEMYGQTAFTKDFTIPACAQ
jgi:hypothetical protein